jgi:hypothetical protein
MSEMGDRYKLAAGMVLAHWGNMKDDKGRSQVWKIAAYNEDVAKGRDSSIVKEFVSEVEKNVTTLIATKPVVEQLCKNACKNTKPPAKQTVATSPIEPATPPADTSAHGIDLGWD